MRFHGQEPVSEAAGPEQHDRERDQEARNRHQSICRRMKVGISMSGTSEDDDAPARLRPRGRRGAGARQRAPGVGPRGAGSGTAGSRGPSGRRSCDDGAVEAGRDDGDPDLALHGRVVAGAEDDLGVVAHRVVDDLVDLGGLAEREVVAAGDVDEHAGGAGDRDVVEQRAGDRLLRRFQRAVLAAADAGAHERRAAVLHDGAHVGEVHVDDAGRW